MMRTMRENTKWIMVVLTLAFVAWLVLDWVQGGGGLGGGTNPVVATVNGDEIRYAEWNEHLQRQQQQARESVEGALTDEQDHQVRESAWDQLITERLLRQEMERLDLEPTEAEIRQAFRTNPPPDLRDHPAFQTDGEFDFEKYREFFAGPGVDQRLLADLESYYRDMLPRDKLVQMVAEGVALSDDELWRTYRDENATARVRYISVDPEAEVPDEEVTVSGEEIRAHYESNRDDFSRPPVARVDLVSVSAEPEAADSAAARSRVDSLRSLLTSGESEFAELAEEASADPSTAADSGRIGTVERGDLDPALEEVAFSLQEGEISRPVATGAGYHLLRVNARENGSVDLSHILVPVQISLESEDELFQRLDRLEDIALREGIPAAADSLDLVAREDLRLEEGSEFVPGAGALGVAVAWAFEEETEVGDLSQFFENPTGFHLLELHGVEEASVRPLSEVEDRIRERLALDKKREIVSERMRDAMASVEEGRPLEEVAAERGWTVQDSETFTRQEFVSGLGRATPAIGAAFGLPVGEAFGPLPAGERIAIVEVLERQDPERSEFEETQVALRNQLETERRQLHVSRWMDALRAEAEIADLRGQLDRGGDQEPAQPTGGIGF